MKTPSFRAELILLGLLLINKGLFAGAGNELKNSLSNELSNFHIQGLYVIGGIIIAGLLSYILFNHFRKEETKPLIRPKTNYAQQRRAHLKALKGKNA